MAPSPQTASALHETATITSEIWDTAPSAEIMLQMLRESKAFYQSYQLTKYDRHFYFFAAACARRVYRLLTDERSHSAIRIAELFAAGAATLNELELASAAAKCVVIELNETYKVSAAPNTINPLTEHPTGLPTRTLRGAALLNAASTATIICSTKGPGSGFEAACAAAKYSSQALYWDLLAKCTDTVLITEFLEEEDRRQAEALRTFLGNPFDKTHSPAMTLPPLKIFASVTPAQLHSYSSNQQNRDEAANQNETLCTT
jgi:hypothetical protein